MSSAGALYAIVRPWPTDRPPVALLRRLRTRRERAFLRLAQGPGARGAALDVLCAGPTETLSLTRVRTAQPLVERLAAVRARAVEQIEGPAIPFRGGWAGMVGYEARSAVEHKPPPRTPPLGFPALWLGWYDAAVVWERSKGKVWITGLGTQPELAEAALERLAADLSGEEAPDVGDVRVGTPKPRLDPETYQGYIRSTREAVRDGEIFQSNISQRFDARVAGDSVALFERLVESVPAPYMTYLDLPGGRSVLSASPERFLRVKGRQVETDPMKGTRPRGATRTADQALRKELEASPKERAELAMIVDLSRNDLSRVCEPGSVRVTVPRRLLRFARVHQAIAVVSGRLREGLDRVDLLQAAFPPGSVTGAPKVRAMEIIDELEGEGRGAYCGALGWFDAATDCDLSVAIRTILYTGKTASYRVGGGITLKSDDVEEWQETLAKGKGMFRALAGREDEA